MMVSLEDIPLKPLGKWTDKKGNYEALGEASEDDIDDDFYSSDGNYSAETDYGLNEDNGRGEHAYRKARWFLCHGWRWWCQRFVN